MGQPIKNPMFPFSRVASRFFQQTINQLEVNTMTQCIYPKEVYNGYAVVNQKRKGVCPVTGRSFADDPVIMSELQSVDISSISCGLIGDLYSGQWLVAGVDWKSLQPLYKFGCGGNDKYITKE